jgi:hypothetical protein
MAASVGTLRFPLLRAQSAAVDLYPPPVQFAAEQAFAARGRLCPMRSTSRQVQEIKKSRRYRLQQPRCAWPADLAARAYRCRGRASAALAAGPDRSVLVPPLVMCQDPRQLERESHSISPPDREPWAQLLAWKSRIRAAVRSLYRCSAFQPVPSSSPLLEMRGSDRCSSRTHPVSQHPDLQPLFRSLRSKQAASDLHSDRLPALSRLSPPNSERVRAHSFRPTEVSRLAEPLQPACTGRQQADLERSGPA